MPRNSANDHRHPYPPDQYVSDESWFTSTRSLVILILVITVFDAVRVGFPSTGIPLNYPLAFGCIYLIAAIVLLRHYHRLIDLAKVEILDVLERTNLDSDLFDRDGDPSPSKIECEINGVLNRTFHPVYIFSGALAGGTFAIVVMWWLGALQYYPYLLMNFAYGAGHGLFFAPIGATVWLVWKAIGKYIVDIDVLDPDGVGGYRQVGDSIVNLISWGIVLVTLDFVVLSSVMFVDEPLFQALVIGMYVGMIVFLLLVAGIGIFGLRHAMLSIREQKTDALREQFSEVEDRYYEKLQNGEAPDPESEHIATMTTMFDQFNSMGLWPINLAAFVRLASTAAGSAIVAAYQLGFISHDLASLLFGLV